MDRGTKREMQDKKKMNGNHQEEKGDAFVNNQRMNVGDLMMKSCVITIGADVLQANRSFVEFVVSHPEVVL